MRNRYHTSLINFCVKKFLGKPVCKKVEAITVTKKKIRSVLPFIGKETNSVSFTGNVSSYLQNIFL